MRIGKIPSDYNLADLFTRTTMTGNMRQRMVESRFHNKAVVIRENDEK